MPPERTTHLYDAAVLSIVARWAEETQVVQAE
jgi:hypothetical protein